MLLLLCIVACLAGAASGVGLRRLAAAKNASTTKPYSWPTDFFDCFDPAERLWAAQQHPSPLPVAPSQPQSSQSSQPPLFSSFNCMNGEVRGCQLAHHATQSNNARLPFFSFKVYFSWLFGRLGASWRAQRKGLRVSKHLPRLECRQIQRTTSRPFSTPLCFPFLSQPT